MMSAGRLRGSGQGRVNAVQAGQHPGERPGVGPAVGRGFAVISRGLWFLHWLVLQAGSRWGSEEQAWTVSDLLSFRHLPPPDTALQEPYPSVGGCYSLGAINSISLGEGRGGNALCTRNCTDITQTSQLFEFGVCHPSFR